MQPHLDNNSNNDDVKLDTLGEQNVLSSAENITLPEDTFKSYTTYLLYEMAHYKPMIFSFLALSVSILIVVIFHNVKACDVVFGFSIFVTSILFLSTLIPFNVYISDEGFRIKLLLEVITHRPAVKGKEWRAITDNMNQYLLDNGLWSTRYYFYSTERCYKFFRFLVKEKPPGVNVNSSVKDATSTQIDAPANEASNEVIKCFSFSSDPIFEAYFVKAVEVEKQAQQEYWRKQYPDADIP
ncbi:BMC_2a_G0005820.mRNA.1.CDS.1 [Saccharomyces cerevisiae]|nr:hypothetical protein H823_YJM1447C00071 [Saccharomyces cerevisiae YJM1447]CAI4293741.1 BMC_2a_G0005820.mRNA.1.CDS.1 [Saccharomyces cerevisiae]CAI4295164.1 BMB_G0005800.mRNA.1.CDS.1 [Saccharomyces cerevisiae]CAI7055390.1 BMC_2a_G0005820.mRNA.1.CDS.1 [Saccharomyces cerevisiae]CAI7055836.1 BMB_G0005800.mRNA.1.CDS.1 [Saccharomyces cerevisiae]